MKKSEFKELVRQCLIELLTGEMSLGEHKKANHNDGFKNKSINEHGFERHSALNSNPSSQHIVYGESKVPSALPKITSGDSILDKMLTSTRESMMSNNQSTNSQIDESAFITPAIDTAAAIVRKTNPADLFGADAVKLWNKAAFSEKKS